MSRRSKRQLDFEARKPLPLRVAAKVHAPGALDPGVRKLDASCVQAAYAIVQHIVVLRRIEKALEQGAQSCVIGCTPRNTAPQRKASANHFTSIVELWGLSWDERESSSALSAQVSPKLLACLVNEQIIELEGQLVALGVEV